MGYVLIVDDNEDAREILAEVIENLGREQRQAKSGIEAIRSIKVETPDLVLLDIMMAGMNGLQVLSWMRSNSITRDVPVIIISASGLGETDISQLPGPTKIIQKASFNIGELQFLIMQMLPK